MTHLTDNEFTYLTKIFDDNNERYYLKSIIDEQNNTILIHLTNFKYSWVGVLNQEQIRILAKKFPLETNDSFYSHTQRAFSKGNNTELDGRNYVFSCKKLEKNRVEFVWKEKIETLNSLKIVGSIELEERPNDEILTKIMDYTIDEIETLRSINEQKVIEIKHINSQLNKALETVKRTVDLKEQLESDLYRKFVLVLNTKKAELAKLKQQLTENVNESYSTLSNDIEQPSTTKRTRHQISHTDTSEDDDIQEIEIPTESKLKIRNNNQDSSLDLGEDQMDYKPSIINKHHQRRKYVTNANSISTRSFINHANMTSTMTTPSLPDDSQTTDDLLNNI